MNNKNDPGSIESELQALMALAKSKLGTLNKSAEKEKAFQQKLSLQFEKNTRFFKRYQPAIVSKFKDYQPKKFSVVSTSTGEANLMELARGVPLYSNTPREQCKQQVLANVSRPQFIDFGLSYDENLKVDFLHTEYINKLYKLYQKQKSTLKAMTTLPNTIGAVIAFGTGLGYHIEYLLDKTNVETLYIVEPEEDIFFASLYTCDWSRIVKRVEKKNGEVVLHIGYKPDTFFDEFANAMTSMGVFKLVHALLYQHYPSEKLTTLITEFRQKFHLLASGWGFFDDGILSLGHDYHNLKRNTPFLIKNAQIPNKHRETPVYMIGNGPSLDASIDFIKANHKKAIVISCGSAINSLCKEGIVPDFHVSMERTQVTYKYFEHFVPLEYSKKVCLLTLNTMYPEVADLFNWTGMAFKPVEPSTALYNDHIDNNQNFATLIACTPQVSNTALAYSLFMGFKNITFFGIDCGYKDPKYHHSKRSLYYHEDGKEKEKLGDVIREGELKVPGNFQEEVYTTHHMDKARMFLEGLAEHFRDARITNCSDGAKINGTIPIKAHELDKLTNPLNKEELLNFIRDEMFKPRPFDEALYLKLIDFEGFNSVVDKMTALVSKQFDTRAAAVQALSRQMEILSATKKNHQEHIYICLEGTLSYVQATFRLIIYGFQDEKAMLTVLKQATDLFIEFMARAKIKYQESLSRDHNVKSYLIELFNDDEPQEQ